MTGRVVRPRKATALAVVGLATLAAACTSTHPTTAARSTPPSTLPASSAVSSPAPSTSPSAPNSGSAAASASAAAARPAAVWPTYHHDAARTGDAGSVPAVTALRVVASARLDGALYASPLVLRDSKGPLVIAATENNTLYGVRGDGSLAWSRHIGPPVAGSTLPCGNIDPSGITGTPAYDPASGRLFAVAFLSGHQHVLVAVDAESGALVWSRPIDPPGSQPAVQQERGALLVSGGRVWVPFGGLYGDCGPYHGYVVGVATSGSGAAVSYQVPSSRAAGIWTASGPAADPAGHLYVSVGNGAQTDPRGTYDMSDSVMQLSGNQVVSFFAPSTWASENARDLDLGTTGPVLLPGGLLFVAGKAGNAYLLRQGALGGLGGNVPNIPLCSAYGGAAYSAGAVFVPCTNGLRAVHISGTTMSPAWRASPSGSPVVGGGVVLTLQPSSGTLYALDPATGAVNASVGVGDPATRFATPAFGDDGHAYVGTEHGHLVVLATS